MENSSQTPEASAPATSERAASRTAQGVAALRAAHALFDGQPPLLDDPISARLIDPEALARMQAFPDAVQTPGMRALRAHVLLRSRYAEDRLEQAVSRGVSQAIALGAGYDTFAYRQPEWARTLTLFEVDQPASQSKKRAELARAGIALPANLIFTPIDFEQTSLADGLARASFRADVPTFVSCLGVLMYLTDASVDSIFRFAAGLPRGSELVFTFSADRGADGPSRTEQAATAVGEPWLSRFDPKTLPERLRGFGFSEVALLTPDEARRRYFENRTDRLPAPRRVSIAHAVV